MKLNTNFVSPILKITPIVGSVIWISAFVLMLLSLLLLVDYQQMHGDMESLNTENIKLSHQVKKLQSTNRNNSPSDKEINQMLTQVSLLNSLSSVNGISSAKLLERLELALPKNTFLKSMEYYPVKKEVLLTAISSQANLLTGFLSQLEEDKYFERVMLIRQSKNDTKNNEVQFDLRLVMLQ